MPLLQGFCVPKIVLEKHQFVMISPKGNVSIILSTNTLLEYFPLSGTYDKWKH